VDEKCGDQDDADKNSQVGFASVVIPVKDEEKSIGALISGIKRNFNGNKHEIIVVDDGSRDRTAIYLSIYIKTPILV
jgi:glycosyltransferase involved in cell wall biosynthesis